MTVPEVVVEADEERPPAPDDEQDGRDPADSESVTEVDQEEPTVMEVDLTEDDFGGGGGLFTGLEDTDSEDQDETGPVGEKADAALGLTDEHSNIEAAINEGAARLAVVGLDPDYKLGNDEDVEDSDCLEAEFVDVFSAFRLGYFGAGFLDEYIFTEEDHIDPAWGLLGAMLCATAFTVWMRPDGDEIVADLTDAILGIGGGS